MITISEIQMQLAQLNLSKVSGIDAELEFLIWDLKEIDRLNRGYEVEKYLNGYYAIGSDGGGEMLTVDLKSGIVYAVPFMSIDTKEKIKIAESIMELVKYNLF